MLVSVLKHVEKKIIYSKSLDRRGKKYNCFLLLIAGLGSGVLLFFGFYINFEKKDKDKAFISLKYTNIV